MSKLRFDTSQQGFTLVEVLVAFVILSSVTIASLEIISSGIRAVTSTEQRMIATALAGQKFSTLRGNSALQTGSSSGQFKNGYNWSLQLSEIQRQKADWLASRAFAARLFINPDSSQDHSQSRSIVFDTILLSPFGRLAPGVQQ